MPARMRALIRALTQFGVVVEEPNRGSHWKAKKDGRTYPIPASRGPTTEIGDTYIRGVCKFFAIDEQDLRSRM